MERTSFSFTRSDVMKISLTKKILNDYEIIKKLEKILKNLKFSFQPVRKATIPGSNFDRRDEINRRQVISRYEIIA